MELYRKSLNTLELPAILSLLSAEAVSDRGKELACALTPTDDIFEARYRQEETSAAKTMINVRGAPGFSGIRDIRAAVKRANIGGTLSTAELLDIAALLRAAAGAIAYSDADRAERTIVDGLFFALRPNKYLEGRISASIIGIDEIADGASAALSDIRRHIRIAGEKIRTSLSKMISSAAYSKALQEAIITVKNDRFVVPVKAEHKSAVPGLVHDISASGATLFIEPMSVVTLNNEIRELAAKEKQEIERILAELSAEVSAHGDDLITNFETLTSLDLVFAKAKLSLRQRAHEPLLTEETQIVLRRCRHPLIDPASVVATDILLGGTFDTLVITGPNTGGKTVALKTLGLFCAMAACGLHLPAEADSRLPVFRQIFSDIGDEQSIEQSLSTFSSHMTNIVRILARVENGAPPILALFDELGAGTDPIEGAALAISVIEYVRRRGALVAATTHYSELKTYALLSAGVENASCEFDVDSLRPTYRLLIGVPGKSNAFAISKRLGLPEAVIDDARARIAGETSAFEEAIHRLESLRKGAETDRDEAYKLRSAAERDARIAERHRAELERQREKAEADARREATRIIQSARGEVDAILEELSQLRRAADEERDFRRVNEAKSGLLRRLNEAENRAYYAANPETPYDNTEDIQPGDRVRLLKYDTLADVISVNGDNLELQAGIMKISAKRFEVRKTQERQKNRAVTVTRSGDAPIKSIAPEIDLRGMTADDALSVLEAYLDSARMAKLESVTVIHGKGTGVLRAAVHAMLKTEPHVKAYRPGRFGEGEIGVTIVEFK
ncbi:MAG: endonuclease MutS2 [Oscillospiraceae bacterium]|jgi:DNA mismatch repair protein MutS2|nr:endonuclease MutS2 [Oscillospiraceae bacterium]